MPSISVRFIVGFAIILVTRDRKKSGPWERSRRQNKQNCQPRARPHGLLGIFQNCHFSKNSLAHSVKKSALWILVSAAKGRK